MLKRNGIRTHIDVVDQFYIYSVLLNTQHESDEELILPVFIGFRIFESAMDLGFVVSFPNELGT